MSDPTFASPGQPGTGTDGLRWAPGRTERFDSASRNLRVAVLGAGIGGISVAYALLRRGVERVELFEREAAIAMHSSGRNAAILLPTEHDDDAPALTKRSAAILDTLFEGRSWLRETGGYTIAQRAEPLSSHCEGARAAGCDAVWMERDELWERQPLLRGGSARFAVFVPQAGVMDISAMQERLVTASRQLGLKLHLEAKVTEVRAAKQGLTPRWELQVHQQDAGMFDWIVDATGAWATKLVDHLGIHQSILPMRRHLTQLVADVRIPLANDSAILWSVDPEVYVRPESGGWLACACDEVQIDPESLSCDPSVLDLLALRLRQFVPSLERAGILRQWPCVRSFTPQRRLLLGPEKLGIAFVAGLGGRGMTVGVGAGDLCAERLLSLYA